MFSVCTLLKNYIANGKFTFGLGSLIPLVFGIPDVSKKVESRTASLTGSYSMHNYHHRGLFRIMNLAIIKFPAILGDIIPMIRYQHLAA